MKIKVQKSAICAALKKVQAAVPANPANPMHLNVMIVADGGSISLGGTDAKIYISSSCMCSVQETGGICVNAKMLQSIAERMLDGEISIETIPSKEFISVANGRNRYRIPFISTENFPRLPDVKDSRVAFTIQCSALRDVFRRSIHDVSREDKAVLAGMLLRLRDGKVYAVGTDGKSMSISQSEIRNSCRDTQIIIPSRVVNELIRLVGNEGDMDVTLGDRSAMFSFAGTQLWTTVVDGVYPNYERVIPGEAGRVRIEVNVQDMISCIERVSVLADADNSHIVLMFESNSIIIRSAESQFGNAEDELSVKYSGVPMAVAISHQRLLAQLKSVSGETAFIDLDEKQPGLKPVMVHDCNGMYLGIIMPIRA